MALPRQGLRVGITIGLHEPGETLWNNGIKQNAAFLADALKLCPSVASVQLVNVTSVPVTGALPWDLGRWPTVPFEAAKDCVDVMIELGGQVGAHETAYIKERQAHLVSYCCGSEYVSAAQSILFDRPSFGHHLFVNQRYDAIWMIPQIAELSASFFKTLRRRPAEVVPFVWDPVFLVQASQGYPDAGEYRPRDGPRRLSVLEPNVDVVKFCLYPVFIAEEAFRQRGGQVGFLHVINGERIAKHSPEFIALMSQLDIVRAHKAAFVTRYPTPQVLAELTDAVISHQWGNPLNYAYLEVCWQGYPLVHNAQLCGELGYYYEGHDVQAGCAQLLRAFDRHDDDWVAYRERQRAAIARFLPSNPDVVRRYDGMLRRLIASPPI